MSEELSAAQDAMADTKEEIKKGVVVEFDFTALNGAEILYKAAADVMKMDEVPFSARIEAQYLAGGNYQGAIAEYFAEVKTKKTAAKAAKDISEAFVKALNTAVPKAVTPSFVNFVKTLVDKDVRVVISTRADIETVKPAFEPILGDMAVLHQETAQTYGCVKWDAWRRACAMNKLRNFTTVAVTGSGYGVKSALLAGLGAFAVVNDHVAYQDFGGADDVFTTLDTAAAKKILSALKVK